MGITQNLIRSDVIGERGKEEGVLAVATEEATEVAEIFAEQRVCLVGCEGHHRWQRLAVDSDLVGS